MPQIPARSTASGLGLPRRAHYVPIEEVVSLQGDLSCSRSDQALVAAFGLENDKLYWDEMKTDGLQICQDELPPRTLSSATRKRLNISKDEAKLVSYSGGAKSTREFSWKYATVPWKEKYAYDLKYLQKRYPTSNIQSVVCSIFSHSNSDTGFKGLTRSWSEGRNLAEALVQCDSGQLKLKGLPSTTPDPQTSTTTAEGVEAYGDDGYESDLNASVSRLEGAEPQLETHREDLRRHIQREDDVRSPVAWKSVILSMRHTDSARGRIDRIPLRRVSANDAGSIVDLDARMLEEEMDDQNINTFDYLLSLQGGVDTVG